MSENTPLVSVIVPFYNSEKYVDSLIDTFKNQKLTGFELIAVNDGSKDKTSEFLHSYESKELPFDLHIIDKENGGVSTARNAGIAIAKGKYICFCDSDDVVSPLYLSLLYETLERTECKMALCHFSNTTDELYQGDSSVSVVLSKDSMLKKFLYEGINYHHCAAMFLRSMLGGEFLYPEGYKYSEDVYLLWKLIASSDNIAIVPHKLYCYFMNTGSAMSKMNESRLDAIYLMQKLEGFMDENAPEFAPEFRKYCVSRHYWSIFWQATAYFDNFRDFDNYIKIFENPVETLKKLSDYPDKKVKLTAKLFVKNEKFYYKLMRFYVRHFK